MPRTDPDDRPRLADPALLVVLAVALVLRVGWVLWSTPEPRSLIENGDAYSYFFLGRQLAEGGGYLNVETGDPTAYYPIGYPAFLAVIFWIVQHTPIPDELPLAGALVQAVIGTLSVGLVFLIAQKIVGRRAALCAAAVTAAFPSLVIFTATLQLETLFTFLSLAAVAILVLHDWSRPPSPARLIAFGAVLGLSALVRPFSIPFMAGLVVAVLVAGFGWRRALGSAGLAVGALAVVVAPWLIRNAAVMDAPVFSTNLGDTVCLDRHTGATGQFQWAQHEGCAPASWPEARRSAESTRRAIRFVLDDPVRELEQIGRRGLAMVEDDHEGLVAAEAGAGNEFLGERTRSGLRSLADWYFRAALLLGAVGLVALVVGDRPTGSRPGRAVFAAAALTLIVVPLGLWGSTRFHVPVLPYLAVSVGAALAWPWARAPRPDEAVAAPGPRERAAAPVGSASAVR